MKNSVARCGPIYNAYAALALNAGCGYAIDGLVGYLY